MFCLAGELKVGACCLHGGKVWTVLEHAGAYVVVQNEEGRNVTLLANRRVKRVEQTAFLRAERRADGDD